MALKCKNGELISYDSSLLIDELRQDIAEFGGNTKVAVWLKKIRGATFCTNYDFLEESMPITKAELEDDEFITTMTMSALLTLLEKQDKIEI